MSGGLLGPADPDQGLLSKKKSMSDVFWNETNIGKMIGGAIDAFKLPGDVYAGKVDPRSDEGIGRAFDMAGTVGTGGMAVSRSAMGAVPEGAVGMFASPKRVLPPDQYRQLEFALSDLKAGKTTPEEIYAQFGVSFGKDGAPRAEISDHAASLRNMGVQRSLTRGQPVPLDQALRHDELFAAYPELKNFKVQGVSQPGSNAMGAFYPGLNKIELNTAHPANTPTERLNTILHEAQHGIQSMEGFPGGANTSRMRSAVNQRLAELDGVGATGPSAKPIPPGMAKVIDDILGGRTNAGMSAGDKDAAAFQLYQREAGEVEARNVENRRTMSPAERRAAHPETTETLDEGITLQGSRVPTKSPLPRDRQFHEPW
jgi:hypothetical protein